MAQGPAEHEQRLPPTRRPCSRPPRARPQPPSPTRTTAGASGPWTPPGLARLVSELVLLDRPALPDSSSRIAFSASSGSSSAGSPSGGTRGSPRRAAASITVTNVRARSRSSAPGSRPAAAQGVRRQLARRDGERERELDGLSPDPLLEDAPQREPHDPIESTSSARGRPGRDPDPHPRSSRAVFAEGERVGPQGRAAPVLGTERSPGTNETPRGARLRARRGQTVHRQRTPRPGEPHPTATCAPAV